MGAKPYCTEKRYSTRLNRKTTLRYYHHLASCLLVTKINWTKVFSTNQSYLAEIIGGVLTENEIPHTIINKQISGYGLGEIEIYVPETEALQAYYLVNLNNS